MEREENVDRPIYSSVRGVRTKQGRDGTVKDKRSTALVRTYLLLCVAIVVGLYCYVLSTAIIRVNMTQIVKVAVCIIPVAVEGAVIVITAFNLWGRLLAKELRRRREETEQMLNPPEAEQGIGERDELYIYDDRVRLVTKRGESVIGYRENRKGRRKSALSAFSD